MNMSKELLKAQKPSPNEESMSIEELLSGTFDSPITALQNDGELSVWDLVQQEKRDNPEQFTNALFKSPGLLKRLISEGRILILGKSVIHIAPLAPKMFSEITHPGRDVDPTLPYYFTSKGKQFESVVLNITPEEYSQIKRIRFLQEVRAKIRSLYTPFQSILKKKQVKKN